jgi:hypothetical protein
LPAIFYSWRVEEEKLGPSSRLQVRDAGHVVHKLLLRHLAPLPLPFDPLPDLVWNVPNQQLVAHDPAHLWEVLIAAMILQRSLNHRSEAPTCRTA